MKYMTFNGRLGRGGYIAAIFVVSIISAVIFVALWFFEILDEESARWVMYLTAAFLMICPSVQRLHDIDHSGAGLLFALIPGFNLGLGLYLLLKPGTPGPNLYGNRTDLPDTQPRDSDDIAKEYKPIDPLGIKETNVIHDDAFYDEVAKEMQENRLIPGVWARAFAEADGDENRAKAIYIKSRVTQLTESARQISMTMGGDTTAVSWEIVNERWVKNTYANGDVTVSDKNTGRMWPCDASFCKREWSAAVSHCDNFSYAGYSDWRLPDVHTLREQFSQKEFFVGVQSENYWSSTPRAGFKDYAWFVSMGNGIADYYGIKSCCYCVWPVRSGH